MFRTVLCTITENLILTPKTLYTVITIPDATPGVKTNYYHKQTQ